MDRVYCSNKKLFLFRLFASVFMLCFTLILASFATFVTAPATYASCLDKMTPCTWIQYHQAGSTAFLISWWYGDADPNVPAANVDFYQVSWFTDTEQPVQVRVNAQGASGSYNLSNIDPGFTSLTFKVMACITGQTVQPTCTDWSNEVTYKKIPAAPDACIANYIWRNAYPGDHVCVTLWGRVQADSDNSLAASRIDPGDLLDKVNVSPVMSGVTQTHRIMSA